MNTIQRLAFSLFALLGAFAASSVAAAEPVAAHPLGQHPAVLVKRQAQGIDTNRFIVMHPAQLMVVAGPAPDAPASSMLAATSTRPAAE